MNKIIYITILLIIWQSLINIFDTPEYIFPSPINVYEYIVENFALLSYHAGITFVTVASSLFLVLILSLTISLACSQSQRFRKIVFPIMVGIKTTPLSAITPLIILWFGTGTASKIIVAILLSIFPMVVTITQGLDSVSKDLEMLFKHLGASSTDVLLKLRLPNSLPQIFTSLKFGSSLCVTAVIIAEMFGSPQGLGYLILTASASFDSSQMISAVLVGGSIGVIYYQLVNLAEQKIVFWT